MMRKIYVSTDGNDSNPGTAEKPVLTLEKARDLIRENGVGPASVIVKSGTHLRTEPFTLEKKDSNTTYEAQGKVRFLGGRIVTADDFKTISDPEIKKRIPEAARSKVVELDLKALGIENRGPFPDRFLDGGGIAELYFDGKRLPLSRWPNKGYTTIKRVLDSGKWSGKDKRGGTFEYREERPGQWQKAVSDGLWLKGFWRVPWEPENVRVASIDSKAGTIKLAKAVGGGLGSKYSKMVNGTRIGNGKENWYAFNLLEELDTPGEYCIHFPSGKLYLWPPKDLKEASMFIADMGEPIIRFKDVENVSLQAFTLEGGLGNGVEITGGKNVSIEGCEIRNLGKTGVVMDDGRNHRVLSCDIHHLGEGGIYIGGGDRTTLKPANHEVLNNHIYHTGMVKTTYAPAIKLGDFGFYAVGCRVAHNLINDLTHAACLYGGNDNIIEYNEIWRIAQDSGDVGAFYTRHDWTSRGNILRYNLVADSPQSNAFYMDDGDSGDKVIGNVIWRTHYGPFIGGGHDNIVKGNLVIDCPRGIHLDDRGVSRGYNTNNRYLMNKMRSIDYKSPPWSEKYPEMVKILDFHPDWPTGNLITGNVLIECKTPIHLSGKKKHREFSKIENNPVMSRKDAGLPEKGDPIPALKARKEITFPKIPGFEPIPISKIGLYKDEFRKTLPNAGKVKNESEGEVFDSETDMKRSNEEQER